VSRVSRSWAAIVIACVVASLSWGVTFGATAPKILTVVQNDEPTTLDPWNNGNDAGLGIDRAICEGLFGFDQTMRIRPLLAKTWSVSPDGLTYTFHLQTGVTFHDGTPFNAAAVKYNFDRVRDPNNHVQKYYLYKMITDVKVVDDNTVQMILTTPYSGLIQNLAHPSDGIVSPTAMAKDGPQGMASHPVCTGPFVFDSWAHGDRILVTRNPHYWAPSQVGVDQIVFRVVPDATQVLALLKTGAAQFVYPIDPVDAKSVAGQSGLTLVNAPSTYVTYIAMNELRAPFNNRSVRLALNYAVNKQALISALYLGYAKEMHSVEGDRVEAYKAVGTYPFDVAKARQLLAEAGFPQGFTTTLWVQNDTFDQKEGVFVQQQLTQVGVTVNVVPMETGTFNTAYHQGKDTTQEQMVALGYAPSNNGADWMLTVNFSTAAWMPNLFNMMFYSNPQVDKLLDQERVTVNTSQRNAIFAQIQQVLFQDAPWIWLAQQNNLSGTSARVTGAYVLGDQTLEVQYARMR